MNGARASGGSGIDPASAGGSPVLAPASQSDQLSSRAGSSLPAVFVERTLDGAAVGLSLWTVVYHLCLVLRWDVRAAVLLSLLASGVLLGALVLGRRRERPPRDVIEPAPWPVWRGPLVAPTLVVSLAAALAFAVELPWPVVAGAWVVAAGLGTAAAWRSIPADRGPHSSPHASVDPVPRELTSLLLAVGWGLMLAAISVTMLRSNPDDVYYVNLSQWIAEHGSFPVRDTIYGDLVYPMTSWPPMASYDALVGTVAHLLHLRAATVTYQVVPPIVAVLAVLALWQLLRQWRVPAVGLALSAAMIFLLFDGGAAYSPGNLFVSRLWQGKIIFLGLAVPLLLVYAARHVARPSRSTLVRLAIGGVLSVGLTTSAMFLTPVFAAASMAPLVRTRGRDALLGFGAMAAYPLGAAVVTTAVNGRSADDFLRKTYRFDPSWFGPEVFHHGLVAFLAVGAVLAATTLLPTRQARVTVAGLAVVVGVSFVPGVTKVAFDVVGLGPTLWRLTWLIPVAVLVGAASARLLAMVPSVQVRMVSGLVAVTVLTILLRPVWLDGDTSWQRPFHDQRPKDTVQMADQLIPRLDTGAFVLADQSLSITIAVFTTRVTTVSPRNYFLDVLRDEPGFHVHARVRLARFVEESSSAWSPRQVTGDLDRLSVDAVCLRAEDDYGRPRPAGWMSARRTLLRSYGLSSHVWADQYVCVWR